MHQLRKYLVASAATLGLMAVTFLLLPLRHSAPDRNTVLGVTQARVQERLYPGGRNAKTGEPLRAEDSSTLTKKDGFVVAQTKYKDGSKQDVFFQPDQVNPAVGCSYYPLEADDGAWHLHSIQLYAQGVDLNDERALALCHGTGLTLLSASDKVIAERVWNYDGTLSQQTTVEAKTGAKHVVDYGQSGRIVGDRLYVTQFYYTELLLKRERRWRDDADHALIHDDTLHADGSRTVIDYDMHHQILKLAKWGKDGINGTTVVGYYAGSRKIRFRSLSSYFKTIATYFRADGSRSHVLAITVDSTDIDYYDKSGKVLLLHQTWWTTDPHKPDAKPPRLSSITEVDAHGQEARHIDFWTIPYKGVVQYEKRDNVTANGITYQNVCYFYREDGSLETVRWFKHSFSSDPVKIEKHTAQENIRGHVPAQEMVLKVPLDDDLPVPPPMDYP